MRFTCDNLVFSTHALKAMIARRLSFDGVAEVVKSGDIIASYPMDKPYPSYLLLKFVNGNPLHVVVATNEEENTCIIITAYEPDPEIWEPDFKRKK
ncbi:MAG: hypothetical protein JWP69_2227 [Flaviaesturariibacter sp.]|nr:hypothetical protein [Flaviaesturariibacter sp.]